MRIKKHDPTVPIQIAFRVDSELLAAIDKEAARLSADRPGYRAKRSEVVRELCWRALNAGVGQ